MSVDAIEFKLRMWPQRIVRRYEYDCPSCKTHWDNIWDAGIYFVTSGGWASDPYCSKCGDVRDGQREEWTGLLGVIRNEADE